MACPGVANHFPLTPNQSNIMNIMEFNSSEAGAIFMVDIEQDIWQMSRHYLMVSHRRCPWTPETPKEYVCFVGLSGIRVLEIKGLGEEKKNLPYQRNLTLTIKHIVVVVSRQFSVRPRYHTGRAVRQGMALPH
ncbi:unnamed protein product [Spodoptera exigua]|nr:unnamed protein product [Spodoptera exigua]